MTDAMITAGFVGDIALTHDYDVLHGAKGPHFPFELMMEVFSRHDLLIGNMEAPFCLGGEPYPMKLSLKTHPGYAQGLKHAGFTALTLGNNHILDYREPAFFETIELLDSSGILWCGAGRDLAAARKPVVMEKKGVKVGMLSCCQVRIDSPFYASDQTRGIAPLNLESLQQDIVALRDRADIVIVSLHWGIEDWVYPTPDQIDTAHRIIEMGAHLVIGHHPHVLQGIERYKHGFIAYSLGNFLFSDVDWRWVNEQGEVRRSQMKLGLSRKRSALLSVDMTGQGISRIRMIPCRQREDLRIAPEEDSISFMLRMKMLSDPLESRSYDTFWRLYNTGKTAWVHAFYQAKRVKNAHKLLRYPVRLARKLVGPRMSDNSPAPAEYGRTVPVRKNNIVYFGNYSKSSHKSL